MTNLEIAKEIIKKENADMYMKGGIFNTRNFVGDIMKTIYAKDGLMIDICIGNFYFEVFGLTEAEFEELESFYKTL
jgi:hypothetical protein